MKNIRKGRRNKEDLYKLLIFRSLRILILKKVADLFPCE